MSTQTRTNGFTAWVNVRLFEVNGQVNNVLCDLFQGKNMKLLLESFTGKSLKRFDSLDELTQQQIITRVEWFVREMRNNDVIPKSSTINCKSIALQSPKHVLNILWKLVSHDLLFTWKRSSKLMHIDDQVVCSVPFKWTPQIHPSVKEEPKGRSVSSLLSSSDALTNRTQQLSLEDEDSSQDATEWKAFQGHVPSYRKKFSKGDQASYPSPDQCALQIVNAFLKEASKGTISEISSLEDLVHSSVICSLVNYFLPHTFAIQVILDDRWFVNVALKTLEKLLFITSPFSCDDLLQGDLQAVCAYVCFICMAGLKYKQSRSVVNYNKQLSFRIEVAMSQLKIFSSEKLELNQFTEKNDLQQKVIEMKNELQRLRKSYDLERCKKWVKHARKVQRTTKDIIQKKVKDRFHIVVVPRALTITDLCVELGINLQLTQGLGYCHLQHKQMLIPDCRIVLQMKKTQQFLEDFSGRQTKSGIRKLLHLPLLESIEVNPEHYPDYELFLETKSKNKTLKANSLFLYQVFSGHTSQWLKILHQTINENDYCGTENLLSFVKETCPHVINSVEISSGSVALHLACQNGFFDIVLLLLENGACVNKRDGNNQQPLHYALRGQHRNICQLLIEWGFRVWKQKNIQLSSTSKYNLKEFCKEYSEKWQTAESKIPKGDTELLKKIVEDHEMGKSNMASLKSRCIDGSTLLHVAAYFGEDKCAETLLKLQVDTDVLDYKGATPLQRSRDAKTMQMLLHYGADLNWRDADGNTALHMVCYGEPGQSTSMDCLQLLYNSSVGYRVADVRILSSCKERTVEDAKFRKPNVRQFIPTGFFQTLEVVSLYRQRSVFLLLNFYRNLGHKASTRKYNKKGLLAIHCAAMQGRKDALQALIESYPQMREFLSDHHTKRDTPSLPYLALANGHLESAKWLISNEFNFTAGEDVDLLFYIISNMDKNSRTILNSMSCIQKYHFRLSERNVHSINFLISQGLNVNIHDKNGDSPLHFAALHTENYEILKLLLSCNAEVNALNKDFITPLYNAIISSNFHGAKLLIDYGANLDYQDKSGLTAFDHIKNIDDWISCGIFSDDINELLRAYDLQQSIQLVRNVADRIKNRKERTTDCESIDSETAIIHSKF
ncbi:uncharacterized protein RB166_008143 [Leptodactylus fuscus]